MGHSLQLPERVYFVLKAATCSVLYKHQPPASSTDPPPVQAFPVECHLVLPVREQISYPSHVMNEQVLHYREVQWDQVLVKAVTKQCSEFRGGV